jgi:hypothetical protein
MGGGNPSSVVATFGKSYVTAELRSIRRVLEQNVEAIGSLSTVEPCKAFPPPALVLWISR